MIERLDGMPEGTLGFLREAVEAGAVRCLCQLGPEFDGYEAGAVCCASSGGRLRACPIGRQFAQAPIWVPSQSATNRNTITIPAATTTT